MRRATAILLTIVSFVTLNEAARLQASSTTGLAQPSLSNFQPSFGVLQLAQISSEDDDTLDAEIANYILAELQD